MSSWQPPSQPIPDDRFGEFHTGLDHLAFIGPDGEALHALAGKLIAAGVGTKGGEILFTGNKYLAFRHPEHIQSEDWLPKNMG